MEITAPDSVPNSDLNLKIEGMTCASCVARIERAIRAVPGAAAVSVNLATERAAIGFSGPAKLDGVIEAIRAAGYEPARETINFAISGMTCAFCVNRVEKALLKVPGVVAANVDLANEMAQVSFLSGAASAEMIERAVRQAGYGAQRRDIAPREAGAAPGSRSLLVSAALTLPVVIMAMGPEFSPAFDTYVRERIGLGTWRVIEGVLTSFVLFGPGLEFFVKGIPALLRGAPEMNSLVALGTFAAWAYSVLATFAPGLFPAGTAHVYFEAAAVIVTLVLLGRRLEARAKGQAGAAIESLLHLAPETAHVLRGGAPADVRLDCIVPGDILLVRPGDRIPLDGVVIEGESLVDESMLTGESQPVRKGEGASVVGGTMNMSGSLTVTVTKTGADTVLARIVRMVEQAQGAKLPIQALADRVTAWFVPAVMAAAGLTFALWLVLGPQPALSFALVNMVAVLIIACPCAMGLATPTSIMVATGRGAELGILFRQATALQNLRDVSIVAFDKTGTLTKGRPELTDVFVAPGFKQDEIVALAAAVEAHSEHVIGKALVSAARDRGLALQRATDFEATPGFGVAARVGGRSIAIGADRFMARLGCDVGSFVDVAARLSGEGKSPVFVAIDGRLAAALAIADPLKPSARAAIAALKRLGLDLVMISGDRKATAEAIGRKIGITKIEAEVLPDGKVAAVKHLRAGGRKVAFVGDGINDAPALAAADVGIAIGTGTDIAIESADVVLIGANLDCVVTAIALSRATLRNIAQNLFWALAYNVVLIPAAAGALYKVGGLLLSPMLAAAAMAFSSLFVVGNALRLKRFRTVVLAQATVADDNSR